MNWGSGGTQDHLSQTTRKCIRPLQAAVPLKGWPSACHRCWKLSLFLSREQPGKEGAQAQLGPAGIPVPPGPRGRPGQGRTVSR